jgi:NifU-like protein involved in Fe-S cluster formation
VIEETECKTFGSGSPTVSSTLDTELVKGKTSRKRWPSRTRKSAAKLALPQRNPVRWPKTLA